MEVDHYSRHCLYAAVLHQYVFFWQKRQQCYRIPQQRYRHKQLVAQNAKQPAWLFLYYRRHYDLVVADVFLLLAF